MCYFKITNIPNNNIMCTSHLKIRIAYNLYNYETRSAKVNHIYTNYIELDDYK